jgi:hypothetical protein
MLEETCLVRFVPRMYLPYEIISFKQDQDIRSLGRQLICLKVKMQRVALCRHEAHGVTQDATS